MAAIESRYTIFRFYQERGRERDVIETGLTLDEAQAHCRDPDTHGEGWFDGYGMEAPTEVNIMAIELRYPVPPVCTAQWNDEAWERWIAKHGVRVNTEPDTRVNTEPDTLTFGETTYAKTGKRNPKGEALYRLVLPTQGE